MSQHEDDIEWVSASDIGAYVYCARAYWLQKVRGQEMTEQAQERLQQGTDKHHEHGVKYDRQLQIARIGKWVLIAGLIVGVFWAAMQLNIIG